MDDKPGCASGRASSCAEGMLASNSRTGRTWQQATLERPASRALRFTSMTVSLGGRASPRLQPEPHTAGPGKALVHPWLVEQACSTAKFGDPQSFEFEFFIQHPIWSLV